MISEKLSLKLMKHVLSIFLRCSVDKSHLDKIHVLLKVVDKSGK